jgi:hypothetical protein
MAVPRPVLLALVGLGLLAAVFMVTRSGTNEAVNSTSSPAAKPQITHGPPAHQRGKARAHKSADKGHKHAKRAHAAKPAKAHRPATPTVKVPGADSSLAGRVAAAARALSEDKAVVFFFSKPGAADDVGARMAVRSLRGMRGVEIFDASLDEVAAYRPMLSSVGISQIPSTVIVRPGKKAVLLQGFVDAGTLRQNVADALR